MSWMNGPLEPIESAPSRVRSSVPSMLWYAACGATYGFASGWAQNHGLPDSGAMLLFTPLYYLGLFGAAMGGAFLGTIAGFVLSIQRGLWMWGFRVAVAAGAVTSVVLAMRHWPVH